MSNDHFLQPASFRQAEVERLIGLIQAGESASIIGMSGTGKSNLFNHLCDLRTIQAHFDGPAELMPVLVRVNFHFLPDFTDRSIYSLMLEPLELLAANLDDFAIAPESLAKIDHYHDDLLNAGRDVLKVQRYFKLAIRALLGDSPRRLVFLLDQFDEVYRDAESHVFANLRGLREMYKYQVCYLTFTRDLLPNLGDLDPAREEFYELLAPNVIGLRPYNPADAHTLLERMGRRYNLSLPDGVTVRLITLTGGHAGLLRAAFLAVARDELPLPTDDKKAVAVLKAIPAVTQECQKIWFSLGAREQRALHTLAHGLPLEESERPLTQLLQEKGVLTSQDGARRPFAPLFAAYVSDQEASWEQPIYFDEAARQVWVLGRPTSSLTRLEFRLFRLLYQRESEVVSKDELIDAGWPDAQGGVSDEALVAAMARLRRKVEPDHSKPRFVRNVHNQGYVLRRE